jgi:beta-glucanase (GH16 family)
MAKILRIPNSILMMVVILAAITTASTATSPTPPPQAAGYSLVFYDNFSNLNLAPDAITNEYPWYRGIWYESLPSPFTASNGPSGLQLTWNKGQATYDTTISSCGQSGIHCQAFHYGYFEASIKWDPYVGAWPTFWMIPVQNIWHATETGELDIMEGHYDAKLGPQTYSTVHDWVIENGVSVDVANNGGQNLVTVPRGTNFAQWHTYGMLWVPGKVTWYFDNVQVLSYPTMPIFDASPAQYYYIMLGAQEGVNWQGGNTTGMTANSLNMYVQWVKAWQQ